MAEINFGGKEWQEATAMLDPELQGMLVRFASDYMAACEMHHNSSLVSYKILAELLKLGWRHPAHKDATLDDLG